MSEHQDIFFVSLQAFLLVMLLPRQLYDRMDRNRLHAASSGAYSLHPVANMFKREINRSHESFIMLVVAVTVGAFVLWFGKGHWRGLMLFLVDVAWFLSILRWAYEFDKIRVWLNERGAASSMFHVSQWVIRLSDHSGKTFFTLVNRKSGQMLPSFGWTNLMIGE